MLKGIFPFAWEFWFLSQSWEKIGEDFPLFREKVEATGEDQSKERKIGPAPSTPSPLEGLNVFTAERVVGVMGCPIFLLMGVTPSSQMGRSKQTTCAPWGHCQKRLASPCLAGGWLSCSSQTPVFGAGSRVWWGRSWELLKCGGNWCGFSGLGGPSWHWGNFGGKRPAGGFGGQPACLLLLPWQAGSWDLWRPGSEGPAGKGVCCSGAVNRVCQGQVQCNSQDV